MATTVLPVQNSSVATSIFLAGGGALDPLLHSSTVIFSGICLSLNLLCGIAGNVLICAAVCLSKTLRTPVNVLILNLSVSDLMNSCVCAPILLYVMLDDYVEPVYRLEVCQTLDVFHVAGGTVQLATVVCISFERHQAIAKPFDKSHRWRRIKANIIATWVLGFVNGSVSLTAFPHSPTVLLCTSNYPKIIHEILVYEFGLYVFVPFTVLSLFFIIICYVRIIYLVQKHANDIDKKFNPKKNKVAPAEVENISSTVQTLLKPDFTLVAFLKLDTGIPHLKKAESADSHNQDNVPKGKEQSLQGNPELASNFQSGFTERTIVSMDHNKHTIELLAPSKAEGTGKVSPAKEKSDLTTSEQPLLEILHPLTPHSKTADDQTLVGFRKGPSNLLSTEGSQQLCVSKKEDVDSPGGSHHMGGSRDNIAKSPSREMPPELSVARQEGTVIEICDMDGGTVKACSKRQEVVGNICMMSNKNKEHGKRRVEAKTAKRTAVVVAAFLVCWLPFSVVIIFSSLAYRGQTDFDLRVIMDLYVAALAFAILAATLNPVIYGVVNKQFRSEFLRLMKKHSCFSKRRR